MFKKILIGTLIGYFISAVFLTVYRYLFGGWTNLFDGTMEAFKADYIFSNIGDYLFLTIGSFIISFLIYFISFKLLNLLFRQKSFSNKILIFPALYIFISIIYLDIFTDISPTGPERIKTTIEIFIGYFLNLVLPILLNLFFLLYNRKNQEHASK
jgi:hypothetical protein